MEAQDDASGKAPVDREFLRSVSTTALCSALQDDESSRSTRTGGGGFTPGKSETATTVEPDGSCPSVSGRGATVELKPSLKRASVLIRQAAVAHSQSVFERADLERIVLEDEQRFRGCRIFLFSLLYFVAYVLAASLHVDTPRVHLLEAPLRGTLVPHLERVIDITGVWSWLNSTFLPTFFAQRDIYGNPLPPSDWSRVFEYSQLRGAVVLEQVRSERRLCNHDIVAHVECFPQGVLSQERFGRPLEAMPPEFNSSVISSDWEGFEVEPDGRRLRPRRPELMRWLPQRGQSDPVFKFFLHPTSTRRELEQRLEYLRLRGWLDEQTTALDVKALVLNTEVGSPRMQSVHFMFSFSRGGGIFATARFETLFLQPMGSTSRMAANALYLFFMLCDSIMALRALVNARRRKRLTKHIVKETNIFRWMNIFLSWFTLLGFVWKSYHTAAANAKLEELASAGLTDGEPLRAVQEEVHGVAEATVLFSSWFHLILTYMNLVLVYRVFTLLKFQPQLAMVVRTLKATSIDLGHFLVIFVPTFVAYALTGMCIFGRRVDEFSSISRAVGTCAKIAIENEFDWNTLSAEDWLTTASWIWTFVLLICLIMLNMVLAIIMDVYSEIRGGVEGEETLWGSLKYFFRRLWLSRSWVDRDELLQRLGSLPDLMTEAELQLAFPRMTQFQRTRLMNMASLGARSSIKASAQHCWGCDDTPAIKLGLDRVAALLQEARRKQLVAANAARTSDPMCVKDIMQSIDVQNHWMASIQMQLVQLREKAKASDWAASAFDDGNTTKGPADSWQSPSMSGL